MQTEQPNRNTIRNRMPRAARNARPVIRAMLMTTAVAWSIGAAPPGAGAASAAPATVVASGESVRTSSGGSAPPPPPGRVLAFSPPAPTPRSTRARQP